MLSSPTVMGIRKLLRPGSVDSPLQHIPDALPMVEAADAAASLLLVKMGHVLGLKEYLGNDGSPLLQKNLNTARK